MITSNKFNVPQYISTNSRGEPSLLGPLLDFAHSSLDKRRAGLHALQIIKLVEVWDNAFSIDTITQNPPIEMVPIGQHCVVGSYLKRYIEQRGYSSGTIDLNRLTQSYIQVLEETFPSAERDLRLKDISYRSSTHVSGRNGPNGPCLTTIVIDHSSLAPLTGNTELYDAIVELATITKNNTLLKFALDFDDEPYLWENTNAKRPTNSRLSIKEESWAKRRVFAIADWFSQSVCKGLHSHLFKWLESQSEDGTFDQDSVSELVKKWSGDLGENPESADLSAATDSIPVEVQAEIITQIAGPKFSTLWRRICCDRDFQVPNSTETVRYKTGQPMGILSSWAMLAVWHHIMCRTCLKYLGILRDPTGPHYTVIGDDVTMNGTDLFRIYSELVGTIQGVGISKSKGFHKETQTRDNLIPELGFKDPPTTAEFAKRIFYNGQEISVIPPDELNSSFGSATQFPELLDNLEKRGYPIVINHDSIPSLTSLCLHKKLALILATNPLRRCPRGVTPVLSDSFLWNTVPWFNQGYNDKAFKKAYVKVLRGMLISTLMKTLQRINNWISFAVNAQNVKVKAWSYDSETQNQLIIHIAQQMAVLVSESDEEAMKSLKVTGDLWLVAKKFLQSLQICFELEDLFKDAPNRKKIDRNRFTNRLLTESVRSALREVGLASSYKTSNKTNLP